MDPIEQQLTALNTDLKAFAAKAQEETKSLGAIATETKTALDGIRAKMDEMQTQLDAVDKKTAGNDLRGGSAPSFKSPGEIFTTDPKFLEAKQGMWRKNDGPVIHLNTGAFPVAQQKSTITSSGLGAGTSGVSMPMALTAEPLTIARQELRLRNIMRVRTMSEGYTFYFVRQASRTNAASPQVEAGLKAESTYNYDTVSDTVRTIAHYTKVSRQALDDISWLRSTIDGELMYGLLLKEESELLSGSGTGEHLNGLITQATAYNTAYNVSGDTKLDKIRHAKLQARLAGLATFSPDGLVLNPRDMHDLELIKTEEGGANKGLYIIGNPTQGPAVKYVWGLPVVESDSITYGTFLLGAFGTAAEIVDRMAATVDISFENEDDFIRNKATIRAEERIGLAVERPAAFITGSL